MPEPIKVQFIDVNALGFAALYQPNLAKLMHNGQPTSALHGVPTAVMSLVGLFPDHVPFVLWDGRSHFRHALLPGYKANRTASPDKIAMREAYRVQTPIIRLMLHALGIPQIASKNCEADDIAGWLCRLLGPEDSIVLSTKDSDWWQALRKNAVWYSVTSKKALRFEDLSRTDLFDGPFDSIDQYVKAKAMAGDSSDDIPGVPKVGIKTAAKLLREYGSFEAMWGKFDCGETIKGVIAEKVAGPEYREIYQRNLELIDWNRAPAIPAYTALLSQEKDMALFTDLCNEYGLSRVLKLGTDFRLDPVLKAQAVSRVSWLLDPCHAPDCCDGDYPNVER